MFFSCTNSGKVINERYNSSGKEYSLSLVSIKEYSLDSETSYLAEYLQYVDTDSIAKLCFMNTHNNSIYIYEEETGDFVKKIIFEKEGNNGVNKVQGFSFINNDSIYVYSYNTNILYMSNQNAEVKSTIGLYDRQESSYDLIVPASYLMTNSPLKAYGNSLYSAGFTSGETIFETTENRPVITAIDYKKGDKRHLVNYPQQYAEYNWGGGFAYRMPYFDIDSSSLIISFSADHHLTQVNISDKKEKRYYAGSSKIEHINSYPVNKTLPIDENKAFDWYMSNASYEGVFYDKFRQQYYRVARLPSKNHVTGARENNKPIIVIVLDSNLSYLGEVPLPKDIKYNTFNCYVSKGGLNIQVITDNEDKLTFHQYLFKE